jgi:calpain-15
MMEQTFGTHDQFNNAAGFYDLNMYLLGVPITIRVDDNLPFWGGYTTTLSAKVTNKGVWMPLIEKAFAKIMGNYSGLVAGTTDDALMVLSGFPSSRITVSASSSDTQLCDTMKHAMEHNDFLACDSVSAPPFSWVPGHAYTLLGCYDVNGEKLVKVRNPWGRDAGVTQPWNDSDAIWGTVSAATKAEIGWTNNLNDGIMFTKMSDFK